MPDDALIRALLDDAAGGGQGEPAAIDVEAVLTRARRRRRPKVAAVAGGALLAAAVVIAPATLVVANGVGGGAADTASSQVAGGAADSAESGTTPPDAFSSSRDARAVELCEPLATGGLELVGARDATVGELMELADASHRDAVTEGVADLPAESYAAVCDLAAATGGPPRVTAVLDDGTPIPLTGN
ncbi:MAG: hypothetical protein J0G30_08195 [Actinomycetales bacterium]|nr:hypothetical protein [Actinomycetales bacterium]